MKAETLGIIGAGAWGTALAHHFAQSGHHVILWTRTQELAQAINVYHQNEPYLGAFQISPTLKATHSLKALNVCSTLFLAVPAQAARSVLQSAKESNLCQPTQGLIITSKGMEQRSHLLMSQVVASLGIGSPVGVLSGPSFALEVAKGWPTAITLASENSAWLFLKRETLTTPTLRLHTSPDIIGAQVCGVVKNVIAIGAGMIQGLNLGENAKAVLIAQAFHDMISLCSAMGGHPETCFNYCGLADLILTAGSATSRNMRLGIQLVQGAEVEGTVEGIYSAESILWHGAENKVTMPTLEAIATAVIQRGGKESLTNLLRLI